MVRFIIAQILGMLALILVCFSYAFNDKKKFLAYQILSNLFYASSFLVLSVLVGGVNTIISIARVSTLYIIERKDKRPPLELYVLFSLLYLLSGNLFYQSPLDIMAIVAYEMFNMAMFIRDIEVTRFMMVLPNIIIVIYNIFSSTFTNALLDFVEITVLVCMIVRFSWSRQNKRFKYLL